MKISYCRHTTVPVLSEFQLSQAGSQINRLRYCIKANQRNLTGENRNSAGPSAHLIVVNFMMFSQQLCNEFILPLVLGGGGGYHIATRSLIHVQWKKQKQK